MVRQRIDGQRQEFLADTSTAVVLVATRIQHDLNTEFSKKRIGESVVLVGINSARP